MAATLLQVEAELGRARRGRGGAAGYDTGPVFWFQVHHYTSRPTPGSDVVGETNHASAGNAGDPQIHTHVIIPNATMSTAGRVGGLDLQRLNGRLKELGATYQAYLATALRRCGADVGLDPETGAARLLGVPDEVCRAFSRRTAEGTRAARSYAQRIGLTWDSLTGDRRAGLLKQGTQGNPLSPKSDDIGDWPAWRRQAAALGWQPQTLLRPERPVPLPSFTSRMQTAHGEAGRLLGETLLRTGPIGEAELRTAAARSLVVAGIGAASDVDAVVRQITQDGMEHEGTTIRVAWSTAVDPYSRAWGRLAVVPDAGHARERPEPARVAAAPVLRPSAPQAEGGVAALVMRLRHEQRARLAPGGYRDAVEYVAELWEARHGAHRQDPAYRLTVSADLPASARDVAQAIRERRQRLGLLGPDQLCIDAIGKTGDGYDLRLALGDQVCLSSHVNADCDDGRHGIIGRNGSVLTLLAIEAAGLTVRNKRGRVGRVPWQRLRDARSGRFLLAHADALAVSDVQNWNTSSEHILAMPAGSGQGRVPESLARAGRHTGLFLVLSEEAELRQLAVRQDGDTMTAGVDALWTEAASNLERPHGFELLTAVGKLAAEGRLSAIRSLLATTHVQERRQADGLEAGTLHRTLQQRQDVAALREVLAFQDWLRTYGAPGQDVASAAAAMVDAIGRSLTTAGRHLRRLAGARRAAWLVRTTLAQRVQGQQEGAAILGCMGMLRLIRDGEADPAVSISAIAGSIQKVVSRNLVEVGRLVAKVRVRRLMGTLVNADRQRTLAVASVSNLAADMQVAVGQCSIDAGHRLRGILRARRMAWLARATLRDRLCDEHCADVILGVLKPLGPTANAAVLTEASLSAAGVNMQSAIRQGLTASGLRLLDARHARRTVWLARTTLGHRLQERHEQVAVLDVVAALRPAMDKSAGTVARLFPLAAAGVQDTVARNLTDAGQLFRLARAWRQARLARSTLHRRLRDQRDDADLAPLRRLLQAPADQRTRSVGLLMATVPVMQGAIDMLVDGCISRMRTVLQQRRSVWLAAGTLHLRMRQQQESKVIASVVGQMGSAAASQDEAMRRVMGLAVSLPTVIRRDLAASMVSLQRAADAARVRRAAGLAAPALPRLSGWTGSSLKAASRLVGRLVGWPAQAPAISAAAPAMSRGGTAGIAAGVPQSLPGIPPTAPTGTSGNGPAPRATLPLDHLASVRDNAAGPERAVRGGEAGLVRQRMPIGAATAAARLHADGVVTISPDGTVALLFAPARLLIEGRDGSRLDDTGLSQLWPALRKLGMQLPGSNEPDVWLRGPNGPVRQVELSLPRLATLLGALTPNAAELWFARLHKATAESLIYELDALGDSGGPPAGMGQSHAPGLRARNPARQGRRGRDDRDR